MCCVGMCSPIAFFILLLDGAVVSFMPWLLFKYVCISWLAEHNT